MLHRAELVVHSSNRIAIRKKLWAIGNRLGIVIEKPILELLKIDQETELDMKAAVQRTMDTHDAALRKLAK